MLTESFAVGLHLLRSIAGILAHGMGAILALMNTCYVYVLSSRNHRHLSVRVTADLKHGIRHHRRRISHRLGRRKIYQKLVHVEAFDGLTAAVGREREIQEWSRARLMHLVSRHNPTWKPISISTYLAGRENRDMRFRAR